MEQTLRYAIVGSAERVRDDVRRFLDLTGADELMIAAHVYDHGARLRSFELVAELLRSRR
jgi:alkanesulfonate monooxygenase SsuD/methylene tetrahydromethanopterin reductase-like flavin-dependent oxidoreductase (luciferase family)